MSKIVIDFIEEKKEVTYSVVCSKNMTKPKWVIIPGVIPYAEGEITIISRDTNLIQLLNTFGKIDTFYEKLLNHKCVMDFHFDYDEIYSNCVPISVTVSNDKKEIELLCKYKTSGISNFSRRMIDYVKE